MRITLITPLYPPDIADPAPYVKELASRFAHEHAVTVLTYGTIPEDIPKVKFVVIPKNTPLPVRVFAFTRALLKLSKESDRIYAQNGASTELPLAIVSLLSNTRSILRLGDEAALRFARTKPILKLIQTFAIREADHIVAHSHELIAQSSTAIRKKSTYCERPHERPEILPFGDTAKEAAAQSAYESSWEGHVNCLRDIIQS